MRTLRHLKQKNLPSVFDKEVIKLEDLKEATTYRYDIVGAEVGDSKETVFYPQVKMNKWDNECCNSRTALQLLETTGHGRN